jgi:hypothetical protein
MIKPLSEKQQKRMIEIDLSGPAGNAFCLLRTAKVLSKEIKYSQAEIDKMMHDMQAGDYDHLLEVFDEHFGNFVTLYKP